LDSKVGDSVTAQNLVIRNLFKRFDTDTGSLTAVEDVSFEVGSGEFFTMLGPSGCGKTTTLRMIAGLEVVTEGSISFAGRDYTVVPARQRNIGMVFQSYALFPHLSVFENIAYGLRVRRLGEAETRRRVTEVLELLQLTPLTDRLPGQLSGGQQQRVSIARALVYQPGLLLLDEPLANLDAKLRVQMREEIRQLQRRLGIIAVYVTHDQEEAMAISDRVAVFNRGRLMQIGEPLEVYATPTSLFVADFIGRANFLPATIVSRNRDTATASLPWGGPLRLAQTVVAPAEESHWIPAHVDGVVMVRPERMVLDKTCGFIPVKVRRLQFLGSIVRYMVTVTGLDTDLVIDAPRSVARVEEGQAAFAGFASDDSILFVKGDHP
jgi:ABC-type Fe3+/spermidine/putrescine transport system ATPase subunit